MDLTELRRRFEFHPADTREKRDAHEAIRKGCQELAVLIERVCPVSREQSLAITHLEDVMYCANAAIARRS